MTEPLRPGQPVLVRGSLEQRIISANADEHFDLKDPSIKGSISKVNDESFTVKYFHQNFGRENYPVFDMLTKTEVYEV